MDQLILLGGVRDPKDTFGLSVAGGVIVGREFYLQFPKLFEHMFIQGTVGSGKTEFLKSLIYQLIQKKIRICVVDGAGSAEFAEAVCVMAHEAGSGPVPVLKYGGDRERSAVFNGFVGSNHAVYSRLVALLALEDYQSDGDYYRGFKRNLLSLVCGVNTHIEYPETDRIDPPRSFGELGQRLTISWLLDTFGQNAGAKQMIEANAEQIHKFREQVAERARPFLHILDPKGFQLGDALVTVFSIDKTKGGQPAEYLFQFLGEAFKDAMGKDKQTIWIIDEIGVFGGRVVSDFTKIGRQKGLGLIMALQSIASLGEDRFIQEILDTTNTKVIMRCDEADELRRRAGTRKEKDPRRMEDKDGMSKGRTVGFRDGDRIKHEDVKSLPTGAGFVVIGSGIVKIQSKMITLQTPFDESMEDTRYQEGLVLVQPNRPTLKGNPEKSPL